MLGAPSSSVRPAVSTDGMVAASQPLAVRAGIDALAAGGTAVDAAVAAAAVLSVVDPPSTGIGGDLFAMVWPAGETSPRALASAGAAPSGMTVEALRAAGFSEMPEHGPWSVTVPGAVAGWKRLLAEYGRMGWERALAPATRAAAEGFRVTRVVALQWAAAEGRLGPVGRETFLPTGRPPRPGERFANPDLAAVLGRLADEGPDALYRGDLAERVARTVQEAGGPLGPDDLAGWEGPRWVDPIDAGFRGHTVFEHPPPGQGLVVLMALGIYTARAPGGEVEEEHAAIESLKLAFLDARAHLADPRHAGVAVQEMLAGGHLVGRAAQIAEEALDPERLEAAPEGDTVYVAAVDGEGTACSLIQSIYQGFGSGVCVPGLGFVLQDRAAGFVLDESHPNRPAPGKRPYHTIIPAMVGRDGQFVACLGVVGALMQPQGQFQVLREILDRGRDPQVALDRPRFRVLEGRRVGLEPGFPAGVIEGLAGRRHQVVELPWSMAGGGQTIWRDQDRLVGGSDRRKDGFAAGPGSPSRRVR